MGLIANPNFQGLSLKRLKQRSLLYKQKLDFRTGLPYAALDLTGDPSVTGPPYFFDRIKLSRSTMCELWYDCKKLKIEAPRSPTGYATLKYLFKASGDPDPSERITYATPSTNTLPPGRNSFFYPLVWQWSMDGVLDESGSLVDIHLSGDVNDGAGGFASLLYTDGKKLFPNLSFFIVYTDDDDEFRTVTSAKLAADYTQVGTIKILGGEENPLWSPDSDAPDYGDVTVTKEESW